jgi:MFS family permease
MKRLSYLWRVVIFLWLAFALNYIDRQASCAVGVVLGGWLADRAVRRVRASRLYLTGCGMFLSAPFAYLMFAADSVGKFRLYAAAFGLMSGLNFANVFAAAYDLIADRNYGFAGSILNMAGSISAGVTVWLAGYCLAPNGLMAITAVMTVFAAGALLFAVWRSVEARRELAETIPIV